MSPKFFSVGRMTMAVVLLAIVVLFGAVTPVSAATFTVNNSGDAGDANPGNGICATSGGVCTLRAAIQEANAIAGADTINIPSMTIIVNSELLVTQSVTINGNSQATTIIDGNNATRVFKFQDNSGTHTLSNLTIRNARYVYSGPYPFLNGGGGIYNEAILTVNNATLANNSAPQGGGIFNAYAANGSSDPTPPSLILNTVSITNNTATSTTQGQGGGGLFNGSILTANVITITNNVAGYQGGGIYINSYLNVTISNFVINNNTAIMGGGLSNELDTLVSLNGGTISGNTSNCCDVREQPAGGGGIVNTSDGGITLTDVTISGNTATSSGGYGGGIANVAQMVLNRVTVNSNSAQYGAGIYNGAVAGNSMLLTNVTISGNSHPSAAAGGGGIWNTTNGNLTIANATITQNTAAQGGGIQNLATTVMRNTILGGNVSTSPWPVDCAGSITSNGYNLVGNTTGCSFGSTTGDLLNLAPNLGALQNNGGSTQTHALNPPSPAINAGNPAAPGSGGNACPASDQRGVSRPQGSRCDIGAYEGSFITVTSLNPSSRLAGSGGFTLNVFGSNFQNGFIVQWDGADRSTTFVNSTQLSASISAGDVAIVHGVSVRVRDPNNPATVSNALAFVVYGPFSVYLPFVQKKP